MVMKFLIQIFVSLKEGIENGTIEIEDEQPQNENIETEEGQEAAEKRSHNLLNQLQLLQMEHFKWLLEMQKLLQLPDGTMTANLYERKKLLKNNQLKKKFQLKKTHK